MSKYSAVIRKNQDGFYAVIVRTDRDGETQVIHGYKGRQFASLKAAEKSTAAYIAKIN